MINEPESCQMPNIPVGSTKMKKCSSTPPHFDPLDLSEALPCYLLVPYGKMMIWARGMVYPHKDGLIHGIPLEDGHMRVSVDMVYSKYNALPLPMENEYADMHVLEDAQHAIIQWPHKSIVLVKLHTYITCEQDYQEEAANSDVSVHAGLSTQPPPMTASTDAKKTVIKIPQKWKFHTNIIKYKLVTMKRFFKRLISQSDQDGSPIHIVVDSGIFENQSYEFNIELDDMVRLISERWLNISIIAWFQMVHYGFMVARW